MRQIVYNLHFRGKATPVDGGSKVLRATATAVSASMTTVVGASGIESNYSAQTGDIAMFESEVLLTGPSVFSEKGSISFGDDHRLDFTSFGQGQLTPSAEPNVMCGAIAWKVEGGEGQFEGATGLITSNFTLSQDGEVSDYQLGLLFVK